MKVLHIVKTAVGAGWVYQLVRVLRSMGMDIVVALPSDTEGLAPKYRETGATVVKADVDFPARQPWRLPAVLRRCRALVERTKPDIIQTNHVGTTYVARLALGKSSPIPRVFWVPGGLHLEHWPFALLDLKLAGPRDFWAAINNWILERYRALGVSPQQLCLARNGFDVSQYLPTRISKLHRLLGLPDNTPLVGMIAYFYAPKLYLGQTQGLKGHEDFISAFSKILKLRPNATGVVIGGPWGNAERYEQTVHSLAQRSCGDAIKFLGHRTDLPEILPDLDVAVQPSLTEGVPHSAAQALLCGVPVVATRVGGLPEIVLEGNTGWLVPPRDPTALARAILDALDHPEEARRRAQAGGALVRTMLDFQRTSREIAGFYEKILAAKS